MPSGGQAQDHAAPVVRIVLAAQVAQALEVARGGADGLAADTVQAGDLVHASAPGADQREHLAVRHLQAAMSAIERRLHQILLDADRDQRQDPDRAAGRCCVLGVRMYRNVETPVERCERIAEASIGGRADVFLVLGLHLPDRDDGLLDQRVPALREHESLRAAIARIFLAIQQARLFGDVRELAAGLLGDRELVRHLAECLALLPHEREQGAEARAQARVPAFAQPGEQPRLEIA